MKNRHRTALGLIMIGSLIAVVGFALMFSHLFNVYSLAGSCLNSSAGCNNQLDHSESFIKLGRYLLFGGIILAGVGGLLASHYGNKRAGR